MKDVLKLNIEDLEIKEIFEISNLKQSVCELEARLLEWIKDELEFKKFFNKLRKTNPTIQLQADEIIKQKEIIQQVIDSGFKHVLKKSNLGLHLIIATKFTDFLLKNGFSHEKALQVLHPTRDTILTIEWILNLFKSGTKKEIIIMYLTNYFNDQLAFQDRQKSRQKAEDF